MAEKEAPSEKGAASAGAAAAGGGMSAWMPVIAVVVLVPVLSYAMAMFVIAPQLEKRFAAASAAQGAEGAAGAHGSSGKEGEHGKEGGEKGKPTIAYEFKDIVSNLAGSMRSRYIKVTFTAYSANAEFPKIAEENRAKLLDATIGVLARLSLADLEDPAAKSKVSNEIIYAMEAVLHERVVEEIYFSEFVIQ
jgi:flagellar FliL protein